jgi:hypothetical protein
MDKDIKTKWIAALRSGEYKQTTGVLARMHYSSPDGSQLHHCCLGVLCEVVGLKREPTPWNINIHQYFTGHHEEEGWPEAVETTLPDALAKSLGFPQAEHGTDGDGWLPESRVSLAQLNDDGSTFDEIADLIEQEL